MHRSLSRDRKLLYASIATSMSLVLVLAVVVGIKQPEEPERVQREALWDNVATVSLLTPSKMMQPGDSFMEVPLKEAFWPRAQVPEGAVQNKADLRGKFARYAIAPGEPITPKKTMNSQDRSGIPIPPGFRAVTIRVDPESAVAYHAIPGTIVDVILTYFEGREVTTQVLVQGARVISLGGRVSPGHRPGAPKMKTLTLSVSQPDAMKITGAKKMGSLSLQLRSHEDDSGGFDSVVRPEDIKKEEKKEKETRCISGSILIDGKSFTMFCDGTRTLDLDQTKEP